jgi:hypothetical protein
MTLAQLIESLGLSGTAAEVAKALNAETVQVTDDALYTWAGVAVIAGPASAEALRMALDANGLGWAVHQLGGSGIQLSHPQTQFFLTQFAAAGVPGCAELAYAGLHYESPHNHAGFAGEVSEADVQVALDGIATETRRQQARNDAADAYNAMVSEIDAWDGTGEPPGFGG